MPEMHLRQHGFSASHSRFGASGSFTKSKERI